MTTQRPGNRRRERQTASVPPIHRGRGSVRRKTATSCSTRSSRMRLSSRGCGRHQQDQPSTCRRSVSSAGSAAACRTPGTAGASPTCSACTSTTCGRIWPNFPRSTPEVYATYPHRGSVPREIWHRLFDHAEHEIGILVYSGLFIAEDAELIRLLAAKARAGVTVRIALGDPDSPHVDQRGQDEGIHDAMAAKIRNAILLYRPLLAAASDPTALHRALQLPLPRRRRNADQPAHPRHRRRLRPRPPSASTSRRRRVQHLLESFERVWTTATPFDP